MNKWTSSDSTSTKNVTSIKKKCLVIREKNQGRYKKDVAAQERDDEEV